MLVDLEEAAELLLRNEVVVFPTETVYGIGANALSDAACAKIYRIKKRPLDNPLIVHVARLDDVHRFAYLPEDAIKILSAFAPGPLTIIVKRKRPVASTKTTTTKATSTKQEALQRTPETMIADTPCSGRDTIALRIPSHPVARALLEKTSLPIAAPSANISGKISASSYAMARYNFLELDLPLLDGGDCAIGIESTILSFLEAVPTIVRAGFISAADIVKKTNIHVVEKQAGKGTPGSGYAHYQPEAALYVYDDLQSLEKHLRENVGIIMFQSAWDKFNQKELPKGCSITWVRDDHEYSRNLYKILHEFRTFEYIFAPLVHHGRYGIHDRLLKAAKGTLDTNKLFYKG